MELSNNYKKLVQLISDLDEKAVLEIVNELTNQKVDPISVFNVCYEGIREVGKRYQSEEYAISGLIMAGDIIRKVSDILVPLFKYDRPKGNTGRILIGTVEGDIHYIGKDIFITLIKSHGYEVYDLGVDVAPPKFLTAIYEFKPDIIGLSCLISVAFESMQETIIFLKENVPRKIAPRAYIIGGNINQLIFESTTADYFAKDAMEGVRLCDSIMNSDKGS